MRELVHMIRGLITRAVVRSSDDGKATQLVDVTIREGHDRAGVEVLQPFGIASRAPAGGLVLVLAVGGDQGDLVALPVSAPGVRLGFLEEGEAALYGADGSRVHVKADGTIEVQAHKAYRVITPHGEITVDEAGLVLKRGDDVTVTLTDTAIEAKVGTSTARVSAAAAKLLAGGHRLVVHASGIKCSILPTVGADPDP
ncbi:phage baseplate assembly protein [Rhodoplanes sp. TEM]|uniref:Phage baseplate assembly protein n=1 Tax=Rhodoplanes tepidamans TaxID=200616 RepID=A0ABT5JE52_RHOTP|nr:MULTISPECIES: phage baseplate assembly protein [Rhodoplanes]MDC7787959.1 phage baseplate assembly protein [Rhodoplanes tepidamans]MDC7984799.1 phage baseplate assembly protein [Rhodoplanes sp. TEM]MDQ0358388.1 phage gp45-like [Rhodoplanes tepidamans]